MYNSSYNNDKESVEMNNLNDQSTTSPLTKQNNIQEKFRRVKRYPTKWRNNITNAMKQRRSVFSKGLTYSGDSLIRVNGYDNDILLRKAKRIKKPTIIRINVSGSCYETHLSTLENYPETLLGNKKKRKFYWNEDKNEYFFDRHRVCFQSILYYYQSNGRLRRPDSVPLDTFLEEVLFFDLGPNAISQINKLENVSLVKHIDLPNSKWRRYIWFYFEYPQHSIFSRIIYFISMCLTVLSSISLSIETLPEYENKLNSLCIDRQNVTASTYDIPLCSTMISSPFYIIQTICVSYFTIEFLFRLISTPSYWKFFLSIFNWIDLGAIIPYFVFLGIELHQKRTDINKNTVIGLRIFRLLRFLRIFRIYLVFKELKSLRVLTATLKESFLDFIVMILILTLMGFLFGAATFFCEQDINGNMFDSIPSATYWGILTITTVGYGDMYPISVAGRILACSCAFFGVVISGILVSVLVDRYQRVYNRKRYSPEQILSVVDSSDSEHEEKQDFINRRLSRTRRNLSTLNILPIIPTQTILSSTNNRKYSKYNNSSSHVRFVISINDDSSNNKSIDHLTNELMEELTNIIHNSGEQIKLKLETSGSKDLSNDKTTTTNSLYLVPEE